MQVESIPDTHEIEGVEGHGVLHIQHEIKSESDTITTETDDTDNNVNLKVLWSSDTSGMVGYQVAAEESLESESHDKSPTSTHDTELHDVGDQEHVAGSDDLDTTDGHLQTEASSHDGVIIAGEDSHTDSDILGSDEGHMLHVPDNSGSLLTDSPQTIQVATSLANALAAHSDHDVIQLLLPSHETEIQTSEEGISVSLGSICMTTASVITPPTQSTVQAITLANGTTAFIQHPNGKFLEGQTITLEDGSTAIVHGSATKLQDVSLVTSSVTSSQLPNVKTEPAQSIQLEDGTTGFLNQAVKDGLQAIILEDGTTAYLASQQASQFMENAHFEPTTLTLDQLTAQGQAVQTLIPNGMVSVNVKPMETIDQATLVAQMNASQDPKEVKQNFLQIVRQADKSVAFGEKAYKCAFDGCGRLYTTLHHLKVHERSHTGDRPFKCDYLDCGKAFATGYGLKSHTRVHTGEKPYRCSEEGCDKAFKTSGDLQKHVRTHTGERPFRCPFEGCNRSFTTSNIRKVHIRTHTGERPYCCPEEGCGRAFASATNYKNHIRIHTGEKPYVCTVQGCGKRFTEYSSLYKHHVVHTHSKPYMCNYCHKTYRQTSTLAMHKRTAHGEDTTAESEAVLFEANNQGMEPPEKRPRISLKMACDSDEGEGTLVINTPDPAHTLALVGSESLSVVAGSTDKSVVQSTQTDHTALLQQAGVAAFTLGDQGQQVYVITDPAQLEALQQIAQHQFDGETLDSAVIQALTGVEEDVSMEPTDTVNPEIVASTEVDNITSAESIDSGEVMESAETTAIHIHELQT